MVPLNSVGFIQPYWALMVETSAQQSDLIIIVIESNPKCIKVGKRFCHYHLLIDQLCQLVFGRMVVVFELYGYYLTTMLILVSFNLPS